MARDRMIRKKFWDDKKLSKISRDARLTFIGMWNHADDYGVIMADAIWIKSRVFPFDNIQLQQFEKWMIELKDFGFISLFSHNSEEFYYLPNFPKHQTINRPNRTDVFVKNFTPDTYFKDSVNDHGIIIEGSMSDHAPNEMKLNEVEGKEEMKENARDADDILFIKKFNSLKNSKFQLTEKVKRQFNARTKEGFTLEDFTTAITNCMKDPFHKDNPNYLTPEFITRSDKLDKYLNYQSAENNSSEKNGPVVHFKK